MFYVIFPKGDIHLDKWRSATQQIDKFLEAEIRMGELVTHVVEQCLGGFSGGLTSKQTLMALAAVNAVVSHKLSYTGVVMHMLPVTTKRIMKYKDVKIDGETKKETVVRLARTLCPTFPYLVTKAGNWKKGVDDMADAWWLAEAGLKVIRGEASIGQPEKTSSDKSKAGRTPSKSRKKG